MAGSSTDNSVPAPDTLIGALGLNVSGTLLGSLYATFSATPTSGTIRIFASTSAGSRSQGNTIYLSSGILNKNIYSLAQQQMIVVHELAHEVLPGGRIALSGVKDPAGVLSVGVKAEGLAYLTEYVLALQVAAQNNWSVKSSSFAKLVSIMPGDVVTILERDLSGLTPQDSTILTDPDNLTLIPNYSQAWLDAGTAVAGESLGKNPTQPGAGGGYDDPAWTYQKRWTASWIMNVVIGLTGTKDQPQYDLTHLKAGAFTETSTVTGGVSVWTFTGTNITLLGNPDATIPTSAGELLSFYYTENSNADGVYDGVLTWTQPKSGNSPAQSTIEGGFGGNDTLKGVAGVDNFVLDLNKNTNPTPTELLNCLPSSNGTITINTGSNGAVVLGSDAITPQQQAGQYHWSDETYNYVFVPWAAVSPQDLAVAGTRTRVGPYTGELQVTQSGGPTIDLLGFNLQQAEGSGFLGIQLPTSLSLTVAQGALPLPAPGTFPGGGQQTYDLAVDTPQSGDRVITVTLAGAAGSAAPSPSDFAVVLENGTAESLGASGAGDTFNVTLSGGESSTWFSLIDETPNGKSDLTAGTQLTLGASLPNAQDPSAPAVSSALVSFSYSPAQVDTTKPPNASDAITGQLNEQTGVTTYIGDGSDDLFIATGDKNIVAAFNSGDANIVGGTGVNTIFGSAGNDVISLGGIQDYVQLGGGFDTVNGGAGQELIVSTAGDAIVIGNGGTDVVLLGSGENEIYANTQVSLSEAISQDATATAASIVRGSVIPSGAAATTGQQGDLLSAQDGNNTIVGSDRNDLIAVGAGADVVVMGSGDDTFVGGIELTSAEYDWTATVVPVTSGTETLYQLQLGNIGDYYESYTDPYTQPYDGLDIEGTQTPIGPANDTIFGGSGNNYYYLGNGNNYLETGSGNDTVLPGVGNDTIIAGSGADNIQGGGGSELIYGGSGADTIYGGDGNNTIMGGSGNATIGAAVTPATSWTGESLEQNSVNGGSGNDLIYGSGGQDTLVAGTGNTTIYGGLGDESIVGGSGNDYLEGGTGNSTIDAGGDGQDTLVANGSSTSTVVIFGGGGSDKILGGSGSETLYAGDGGVAGAMTSVFASQTDSSALTTIYGGSGDDLLEGGAGATVIYTGDGSTSDAPSTVVGDAGDLTVYGGDGSAVIAGGSGSNLLYGGDGDDQTLIGGTGVSTVYGGAGSDFIQDLQSGQDLLVAGTGDDSLLGTGSDTLVAGGGYAVLQAASDGVTFLLNPGFGDAVVVTSGSDDLAFGTGIDISDLSASLGLDSTGNSDLQVTDSTGDSVNLTDALIGGIDDVTFADSGSMSVKTFLTDLLGGGDGQSSDTTSAATATILVGLDDDDTMTLNVVANTVSSWGAGATVNGGTNFNSGTIYSFGSSAVISTGDGEDTVVAAGNDASVYGGASNIDVSVSGGSSLVTAGMGFNLITASGTNDTLVGNSGSTSYSTFYVNDPSTVVSVPVDNGDNTIVASVSYTAPANVDVLTLTGTANIVATGNGDRDTLEGGAGADTLVAGTGVAVMYGSTGNTTFVVNNTADVVSGNPATTNNQVVSSVSYSLPTYVNTLVLTGNASLVGTANTGNDTLVSNSGVDTLIGGSGNDTFVINNPNDVIVPGTGSTQVVIETSGNYSLGSGAYQLVLTGSGNLTGTADGGNDTLVSNSGVDTLYGGSGNDTFVINNSADVVVDTYTSTTNQVQSSVNYSLPTNVNTLTLTGSAALSGTGNGAANVMTANAGADTLVAGTGVATLFGGAGNDVFVVDSTRDVVRDSYTLTSNTLQSSVSYSLVANVNTLVLTGSASLSGWGNSATDTLISNSGVDTLTGGTGSDTFVINNVGDVIQETSTAGVHSVVESAVSYTAPATINTLILTGTANSSATANSGNDSLVGGAGLDMLIATTGQDTLVAGSGATTLVAGSGNDLLVVNSNVDVVNLSGATGADTLSSSVSFTLFSGLTTLALSGTANLSGAALSGNNSIIGNAGSDVLSAGSGQDTLIAGSGVATLVGGGGSDTFVINNATDVIENISSAPANQVVSSVSYTMAANITTLTLSGSGDLVGVGNGSRNTIVANDGNDTLIAGSGAALLVGGEQDDLFIVNSTLDDVTDPFYGAKAGYDTIESSVSYTLPGTVNVLLLTGSGSLVAVGNQNADSIVGNAGLDTLSAGTGNDTLVAGSGTAILIGGDGNDLFVIDSTADVVQDAYGTKNNTVFSSVSYSLPTNVNNLVLTGTDNLVATANAGNDSLVGNTGSDSLIAGSGNDTLVAGAGPTTLVGGSGNDTFIINSSADVIENIGANDAVISSLSYVLPTGVNAVTLQGGSALSTTGNAANDTLQAGGGLDTLIAGAGIDTLLGGPSATTFVINNTGDVVQDTYAGTAAGLVSSVSYVLPRNVNTLILTGTNNLSGAANAGADTLVSNSGVDLLVGGAGSDTFVINNSADVVQDTTTGASNTARSAVSFSLVSNVNTLALTGTASLAGYANGANDTLVSNSGVDTLFGGAGADTFVIYNAADVVEDTSGTTSNVIQSTVSYTLPTDVNALTLIGTAGVIAAGNSANDVLTANSGNDTLIDGTASTTLFGGGGDDLFVVNSTNDVVRDSFTTTSDTVQSSVSFSLPANVGTLVLTGTASLLGAANGAGDTLVSNSGVDTLVGGSGADVLVVNNPADVLQNVSASDIEEASVNYTLSGAANELMLLGTAALYGTAGANGGTLIAGSGNDTLDDGGGTGVASNASTLIGGAGNDTFVVTNYYDVVQDSYTSGDNAIITSVSYSLPVNVDSLTVTGNFARAYGNEDDNNVITANGSDDTLVGEAVNNTLVGGTGTVVIDAGPFDNLIYAGNGGTGADVTYVYGNASGTNEATQSTIYGGSGYDILYGGGGSDLIVTGSGTSQVRGGSGDETIIGTSGTNQLLGGTGTNLIYGGAGTSSIAGAGTSNVFYAGAGGTTANPEIVGDESSSSTSQTTIYGGSGVDWLWGGSGSDLIYGGTGPDTLAAGTGTNTLYGGAGGAVLIDGGSGGRSLLVAGAGAETLDGTGGDTLVAGTGNDVIYNGTNTLTGSLYEFNPGFGNTTLGNPDSANDTISFGAGIEPGDLSIGAVSVAGHFATPNGYDPGAALGLVINDGSSSILVEGGFLPSTVDTLEFADGTSESVAQLVAASNLGLLKVIESGYNEIISTGNNQTFVGDPDGSTANGDLFAFGNNDNITWPSVYVPGGVFAYGSNDTVAGSAAWLAGSNDVVTLSNSLGATISGANDTVNDSIASQTFFVMNSSVVFNVPTTDASWDDIDAFVNYDLNQGFNGLTLDSAVGGITAGFGTAQTGSLTADGNYDTLYGGSGYAGLAALGKDDVLVGGSGPTVFVLNDPTDSIVSGSGDPDLNSVNTLFSYTLPEGVNTLIMGPSTPYTTRTPVATGNNGNDSLRAGSFSDPYGTLWFGGETLVAGSGNDTLDDGDFGGVAMIGGTGNDTFIVTGLANVGDRIIDNSPTSSNLLEWFGHVANASITLPTNVNSLQMFSGGQRAVANEANDLLSASGQSDATLVGGIGSDTLIGSNTGLLIAGSGNTSLVSGGADTLVAGAGNDTFVGTGGADTLEFNGPFGNDPILNASNGDVIEFGSGITPATVAFSIVSEGPGAAPALGISYAGGGTLTVQGGLVPGAVADIAFTGGTALTIPQALGLGRQTIGGAAGNLILTGNSNDSVSGGSGQDTLYAWGTGDTLTAGTGGAVIYADGAGDLAQGSAAADTLVALAASDTLVAGAGTDSLVDNGANGTLLAGAGTDSLVDTGANGLLVAGVGTDSLVASGPNTTLQGGSGSDTLVANGTGSITLNGGSGNQTFVVNDGAAVVQVSAGVGTDTVYSSVSYVVPTNVTDMILTGTAALQAYANTGNDSIVGNSGSDLFVAGSGDDTFVGGSGGAAFELSSTADVITEPYSGTDSEVQVAFSYSLPANIDGLNLIGAGGITGTGNSDPTNTLVNSTSGTATLIGGSGNDSLIAGKRITGDVLISGSGVDTLVQGYYANTYVINNSQDVIVATEGGDTIETSVNYDLGRLIPNVGPVDTWQLLGSGSLVASDSSGSSINVTGNAGNDTLIGGSGLNELTAGTGVDTLIGGGAGSGNEFTINNSADVIITQAGASNSVFSSASFSVSAVATTLDLTASAVMGVVAGNNDTLEANGGDTLVASGANEALFGAYNKHDTLVAGSGSSGTMLASTGDTIVLDEGFGNTQISLWSDNSGTPRVTFGAGITDANLTVAVTLDSSGRLALAVSDGAGTATLDGALSGDYQIVLPDGSVVTSAQALQDLPPGTSFAVGANGNLIFEGTPSVAVTGGSGNDTIYAAGANDTITGGTGNPTLIATGTSDSVVAGPGNDQLTAQGTGDTLVAGSGNDTIVATSSDTVLVDAGFGNSDITVSANGVLTPTVTFGAGITLSNLTVGGALDSNGNAQLTLEGNTGTLTVSGALSGTPYQFAFANGSTLTLQQLLEQGEVATSTLAGGAGNFIFEGGSDTSVAGGTGADTIYAATDGDTILGGSGTQLLAALAGGDSIVGGTASDTLSGLGTNDTLAGGSAADTLVGGTGATVEFVINNTADKISLQSSPGADTVAASVSYSLPTNVNILVLTAAGVKGTANSTGADTLISSTAGVDTLAGGSGSETFIVNVSGDTVTDNSTSAHNTVESAVSFSLPTDVNTLILTGRGTTTGTGNSAADLIVGSLGTDTLTAVGTSATTLEGGGGTNTFVVVNTKDVVSESSGTGAGDVILSSVSYTLPTNVNVLNVTGTSAVLEVTNGGNDSLTANSAADTLVAAGSGTDTLVAGTAGKDSLVGGSGSDLFVVNNTADVVTVTATTAGTSDTIQSSVSYSLPANVQYLSFTGTATVTGTGNGLTDLIVGNSGTDTLNGSTGIAVLEGGTGTSAHDVLKGTGNQAALIGGGGGSTLTGGAFKDFFAAGAVSDSITTGATANVIAVNKGDVATTVAPTTGASDVLSLGAGIDTESLTFTKSGTANLILSDGVGDSITFTNWFSSTSDQNVKTLQVVEAASASYNPSGTNSLQNKALEEFNFGTLVAAFTAAGSISSWALSNDMAAAQLTSSATAAYGGDLAYYYGLDGNLTGMTLSAAQAALTNSSYATGTQTIDPWTSISGGSGVHLLEERQPAYVDPVKLAWMSADASAQDNTPLLGGELESGAQPDTVSSLLVAGVAAVPGRRTIDTPRAYTL